MVNINDIRNEYKIDLEFGEDLSKIKRQTNPKIIAFYAEKGGVGKTTISLTLAHMLAERKKRVLLVDCDVQRSLTAWVFGTNIDLDQTLGVNKVDNFIRRLPCPGGFKKTLYEQVVDSEIKPAAAIRLKKKLVHRSWRSEYS